MRMSLFIFCLTLLFSFSVEANKKNSERAEKRQPASSGSFHCESVHRGYENQRERADTLAGLMNGACDPSKNFSIVKEGSWFTICCIVK